jgi:hypothetical protein
VEWWRRVEVTEPYPDEKMYGFVGEGQYCLMRDVIMSMMGDGNRRAWVSSTPAPATYRKYRSSMVNLI